MSISSELARIKSAKSSIRSAITAKGGTPPGSNATLDAYAAAIETIPSGGNEEVFDNPIIMDGNNISTIANDVKYRGKFVAYNGITYKVVAATSTGATQLYPSTTNWFLQQYTTEGLTATGSDILLGKSAITRLGKQTGSIINQSGNNITISDKSGTYVPSGYYDSISTQITLQDENKIIPSNIKQGVSILGVTGTYAGSSAATGITNFLEAYEAGYNFNGKTITITKLSDDGQLMGNFTIFFENNYEIRGDYDSGYLTISFFNPYPNAVEATMNQWTLTSYQFRDGVNDIGTNCIISRVEYEGNEISPEDLFSHITITFDSLLEVSNFLEAYEAGYNFNGKTITITKLYYNSIAPYSTFYIYFENGYKIKGNIGGGMSIEFYPPGFEDNDGDAYMGEVTEYEFADLTHDSAGNRCIVYKCTIIPHYSDAPVPEEGQIISPRELFKNITITFDPIS